MIEFNGEKVFTAVPKLVKRFEEGDGIRETVNLLNNYFKSVIDYDVDTQYLNQLKSVTVYYDFNSDEIKLTSTDIVSKITLFSIYLNEFYGNNIEFQEGLIKDLYDNIVKKLLNPDELEKQSSLTDFSFDLFEDPFSKLIKESGSLEFLENGYIMFSDRVNQNKIEGAISHNISVLNDDAFLFFDIMINKLTNNDDLFEEQLIKYLKDTSISRYDKSSAFLYALKNGSVDNFKNCLDVFIEENIPLHNLFLTHLIFTEGEARDRAEIAISELNLDIAELLNKHSEFVYVNKTVNDLTNFIKSKGIKYDIYLNDRAYIKYKKYDQLAAQKIIDNADRIIVANYSSRYLSTLVKYSDKSIIDTEFMKEVKKLNTALNSNEFLAEKLTSKFSKTQVNASKELEKLDDDGLIKVVPDIEEFNNINSESVFPFIGGALEGTIHFYF